MEAESAAQQLKTVRAQKEEAVVRDLAPLPINSTSLLLSFEYKKNSCSFLFFCFLCSFQVLHVNLQLECKRLRDSLHAMADKVRRPISASNSWLLLPLIHSLTFLILFFFIFLSPSHSPGDRSRESQVAAGVVDGGAPARHLGAQGRATHGVQDGGGGEAPGTRSTSAES